MASVECGNRNKFCFVCGKFAPSNVRCSRPINDQIENAYRTRYNTPMTQYWYTPEVVCMYCRNGLLKNNIKYTLPMQWIPRTRHAENDCYFCLNAVITKNLRYKTRDTVQYIRVASVVEPVTPPKTSRRAVAQGIDYTFKYILIETD